MPESSISISFKQRKSDVSEYFAAVARSDDEQTEYVPSPWNWALLLSGRR